MKELNHLGNSVAFPRLHLSEVNTAYHFRLIFLQFSLVVLPFLICSFQIVKKLRSP